MGVKAPAEKNFRRARAKPGRRRRAKARVSWRAVRIAVAVVLVSYATYRAFDLVLSAAGLRIQRISVKGNARPVGRLVIYLDLVNNFACQQFIQHPG